MFKKLKEWLQKRRMKKRFKNVLPIDGLIYSADNLVSIWNGMNYYGEFMITAPVTDPSKPTAWGTPENTPWIQLGFGIYESGYGDWGGGFSRTQDDMVKVCIDKDMILRKVERISPYYNGPKMTEKQKETERELDFLVDRIHIGDKFQTNVENLTRWVDKLFSYPPEERYKHAAKIEDILHKEPSRIEILLKD